METTFCKECNAKHIVGEPCTVCEELKKIRKENKAGSGKSNKK